MSFQPLPSADGEMCLFPDYAARMAAATPEQPPSAEWKWAQTQFAGTDRTVSLPPLSVLGGNMCEVPSYAAGSGAVGAQQPRRPLPPLVGERAAVGRVARSRPIS